MAGGGASTGRAGGALRCDGSTRRWFFPSKTGWLATSVPSSNIRTSCVWFWTSSTRLRVVSYMGSPEAASGWAALLRRRHQRHARSWHGCVGWRCLCAIDQTGRSSLQYSETSGQERNPGGYSGTGAQLYLWFLRDRVGTRAAQFHSD